MKRFLLIAFIPLCAAFTFKTSSFNLNEYNQLALQIKNEIEANAVTSFDGKTKVNYIDILTTGEVTLYFDGKREVRMFNLFELYKTHAYALGISLAETETFIRFNFSDTEYTDIHFETPAKAKKVYEAFIELILAGKEYYTPDIDLNITQTTDSINILLKKYATFQPQIRVSLKGSVIITNTNMQFFTFNLQNLSSSDYNEGFEINGIEMIPCTKKNVGANNWIKFNTGYRTTAFLKFDCINDAELSKIHQLLIHLKTSVTKVMNS